MNSSLLQCLYFTIDLIVLAKITNKGLDFIELLMVLLQSNLSTRKQNSFLKFKYK
jgi:hypothetical protein